MWMSKSMEFAGKGIYRVSQAINVIGICFLLVMVMVTVADVFLRYVFNSPIPGAIELTEVMVVILGSLCLGWCEIQNGHIRVNLFSTLMSDRLQKRIDVVTDLGCLYICILIAWNAYKAFTTSRQYGEETSILNLPVSPFRAVFLIGLVVLCLALARTIAINVREAVKK